MKVFVTGGTGAIGGHAVPALVEDGHEVTALARTPEKAEVLAGQGATPVIVSLFDRDALADAFAGQEAVVNLASSLPSMSRFLSAKAWERNKRIRAEGSAAVVDAALAAGTGRVIQESVSMIYPDRGAEWIDEDVPAERYPLALGNLAAAGKRQWFRGPGRAALLLGDRLTSLTRSVRVGNARFREATGWAPRYPSAREGWVATANALA